MARLADDKDGKFTPFAKIWLHIEKHISHIKFHDKIKTLFITRRELFVSRKMHWFPSRKMSRASAWTSRRANTIIACALEVSPQISRICWPHMTWATIVRPVNAIAILGDDSPPTEGIDGAHAVRFTDIECFSFYHSPWRAFKITDDILAAGAKWVSAPILRSSDVGHLLVGSPRIRVVTELVRPRRAARAKLISQFYATADY